MVLGPTMTMVCSVGGAVADGSVVDSEEDTSVEDSSEADTSVEDSSEEETSEEDSSVTELSSEEGTVVSEMMVT